MKFLFSIKFFFDFYKTNKIFLKKKTIKFERSKQKYTNGNQSKSGKSKRIL